MGSWDFTTTVEWEGAIQYWLQNSERSEAKGDTQSALSARMAASAAALKWLELFAEEHGDKAAEVIPVWSDVLAQLALAAEAEVVGNQLARFYYRAQAQLLALRSFEEPTY